MSVHELYRLLVGEIGISRYDFWYELNWREVRAIIDGYNRRRRDGWEQARLIAYHVAYCMGVPKDKTVPLLTEWLPFQWERQAERDRTNGDDDSPAPTPQAVADLRRQMEEYNREHAGKTTK